MASNTNLNLPTPATLKDLEEFPQRWTITKVESDRIFYVDDQGRLLVLPANPPHRTTVQEMKNGH